MSSPRPRDTPASVPLLDLHRQYEGIREEVLAAIARVCDSQSFILGPEVEALENEIASLTGAAFAVGCASGTEALWLALVAAGVKPGDSVITTPFSFFASASAIVRAGATPVFVDVDPETLNLDAVLVGRRLRREPDQTKPAQPSTSVCAILPVHLYGQCADMERFHRIAEEFEVAIVEDAAQAIGAEWSGHRAGSLGVTAAFSFYPTKNLSAYGDAGIVTTTCPRMAEHMRRLRNHGSPRRYYHHEFGWNGRMDAIQAAVLRVKLPHIADWNRRRQQHSANYDLLFVESGLTSALTSQRKRCASAAAFAESAGYTCVSSVCDSRPAPRRPAQVSRGTKNRVGGLLPFAAAPAACFLLSRTQAGDLPVAEKAAEEVLALPMFPELTEAEIRWVVESIADFYS